MFALPIFVLLVMTVVASCVNSIFGGYFSKKVTAGNYYTWFYCFVQSTFCGIAVAVIFLVSGGIGTFSLHTLLLGALIGVANVLSTAACMKAFAIGPFSYTTVISSLSAIIPALSGYFFGETVTAIQYIGVFLMAVCLLLSPEKKEEEQQKRMGVKWLSLCLLAALASGAVGVLQKLHQNSAYHMEMAAFLISGFAVSAVFAAVMLMVERGRGVAVEPPRSKKALWVIPVVGGFVFAFPHTINLFLAGVMEAVIMFPTVNLCPMILSMICGFILFREKLSLRRWIGIIVGIFSTVFVSGVLG